MTNDVDTLAAALYATTDDMLKEHPDLDASPGSSSAASGNVRPVATPGTATRGVAESTEWTHCEVDPRLAIPPLGPEGPGRPHAPDAAP
ncbi:hypothetical protein QRN89_01585 [Streptomyces chengbuensis]|uniref:hypothetical protein n=1 Tax=Streptomyces TaxID=1883 RepID=UPI0025B3A110|nr:hypothetical protein [Streptomyces sp. HUAS CB01]WJY48604.1 hypothetical protein QRN89_01585 [Streptomyces sp. HUAS CB01]